LPRPCFNTNRNFARRKARSAGARRLAARQSAALCAVRFTHKVPLFLSVPTVPLFRAKFYVHGNGLGCLRGTDSAVRGTDSAGAGAGFSGAGDGFSQVSTGRACGEEISGAGDGFSRIPFRKGDGIGVACPQKIGQQKLNE
jgi:hypothetical protein